MMLKKLISIIAISSALLPAAQANGCIALHIAAEISVREQSGNAANQVIDAQSYQDPNCPLGSVAVSRCILVHVGKNGANQVCKSVIIQGSAKSLALAIPQIPNISKIIDKKYEVILPDGSLSQYGK